MGRLKRNILLTLGLIAWPVIFLLSLCKQMNREQLHFPSLQHCSQERSRVVLRFRQGAIFREAASGPDVQFAYRRLAIA